MINTVFLDMDGVLVDFIGKTLVAYRDHRSGLVPDGASEDPFDSIEFINSWPAGEWDVAKILGMDDNDFWEMIHTWNDGNFWRGLNTYTWSRELVDAATKIGTVRLLTSPSNHPTSYSGKKITRDTYFPEVPMFLCKEKYLLAASDRLLIDDNDRNVEKFREAGGKAILFPQIWNANYEWKDSPMVYVGMQLEKLLEDNGPTKAA